MQNAASNIQLPPNEPVQNYAPGSKEKKLLMKELERMGNERIEIPLIINGKEIKTGNMGKCVEPHNHKNVIGEYHKAGKEEVQLAIDSALEAKEKWENLHYQKRASIFLKAAELLRTKYRYIINAAAMLDLSKNAFQAEIDAAAELIDFFTFNAHFMKQLYKEQPLHSPMGIFNYVEHRALEGFVFAITPFNFASITGNLPAAPASMGNVVVWKPASSSVYSAYFIMKLFQEAGVPDGVINFVPGSGSKVGPIVMKSEHLAGIHFTGSTAVFQSMWKLVGNNIANYRSYPRIVGETGGKDFIVAHKSADVKALSTAIVRGAFEYQGQKCSAASRGYIPKSLWAEVEKNVAADLKTIKMGPVQDFSNFVNAVIDQASFNNAKSYIEHAKSSADAEIIIGGHYDDSEGYFIEPTIILAKTPKYKSMVEEIFAPIFTIYVYEDEKFEETLELCDNTSMYALTGAVFSQDRYALDLAFDKLRHAAGNFYLNDKPTGAVVGQQPFGGGRGSGTNDKAGSLQNIIRWVSPRTVKENYNPPYDYRYPFLG
ncbi:MAG: L-glutamate gamma-semialdehyde dehydrogenase [Candidatus Cloacimonadota bacterium]|nr:L-glutamate gamma-semialdehyde dehydrogenase [Candidatus Cloacimonadota bacterium]